jgi:hypothetical protein
MCICREGLVYRLQIFLSLAVSLSLRSNLLVTNHVLIQLTALRPKALYITTAQKAQPLALHLHAHHVPVLVFFSFSRIHLMRCIYCSRSSNLLLLTCTPPKMLYNVSVGSYRLCIGPLLVVSCEDFRHSNLHSNLAVLICRNCM